MMRCYRRYITFSAEEVPTDKMFCENIANKLTMPEFVADVENYIRPSVSFNPFVAWDFLRGKLFKGVE